MYALIKTVGADIEVLAVSADRDLLRKRLVRVATKFIKDYYLSETNNGHSVDYGRMLLKQLNESDPGDQWNDMQESYLYSLEIVSAPLLSRPRRKRTVKMAYGSEPVRAFDDCSTRAEFLEVAERYKETDQLVVRQFDTAGEERAYFQGINDSSGWEKIADLKAFYPSWSRLIPDKPSD